MALKTGILARKRSAWVAVSCLLLMASAPGWADEPAPERVQDLRYGWVLYNYHQGQAFDALTQLSVASEQGVIQGHGDHPALVEGGLLLSYGMTREAGELFTRLLGDDGKGSALSPEVRNQAWFYLGKVLYLEADYQLAEANLNRVDGATLETSEPELYQEWLYLQARLAEQLASQPDPDAIGQFRDQLDPNAIWAHYLTYNTAMAELADGNGEAAIATLAELIRQMEAEAGDSPEDNAEDNAEQQALMEKSRLSLARIYLANGRFDEAFRTLELLSAEGPFSDRALFEYAVAAAGQGEMARALNAVNVLSSRQLFSPWLQQVPYARGYLLEQMERPAEALAAFREAADRYERLEAELVAARTALTEDSLMARLEFQQDGDGKMTDAYGRLKVMPSDFGLSEILATESFQQALSELHDLYRMQAFLDDWQQQLASFELMLETRQLQRTARIKATRQALAQQQADQWAAEHQQYQQQITEAVAREDYEFFMTAEQKELKTRLERVAESLAALPNDERTQRQRAQYRRMQAHFDWMIVDDYGVNRWAAQRQLRELDTAMAEFRSQRQTIETLMADDKQHQRLSDRLAARETELTSLRQELELALSEARGRLMARVDQALLEQRKQLRGYRVASRHAQARLADRLYQLQSRQGAGDE